MSRIGNNPVELGGVSIRIGKTVWVSGPLGSQSLRLHHSVLLEKKESLLMVKPREQNSRCRAMQGTVRSLVNGMVRGVSIGFRRTLIIVGVGYRAQLNDQVLTLYLGLSHPVLYRPRPGVQMFSKETNELEIVGVSKQLVGMTAAEIRRFRPLEPYKGKGIRLANEKIIIKERKKTK